VGEDIEEPFLPPPSAVSVWNAILFYYFPAEEGYLPFFKWVSDIHASHTVRQHVPNGNDSYVKYNKFFVIESRSTQNKVSNTMWTHAKDQLITCINSARDTGNTSIPLADTVYGAVAIGHYVKMYRYNRHERTVTPCNEEDREYHVRRQCATIHNILQQIKDSH